MVNSFHKYPESARILIILLVGGGGLYIFSEVLATSFQYWDDFNCGIDSILNLECVRRFKN
jgi:hypothetical protein